MSAHSVIERPEAVDQPVADDDVDHFVCTNTDPGLAPCGTFDPTPLDPEPVDHVSCVVCDDLAAGDTCPECGAWWEDHL